MALSELQMEPEQDLYLSELLDKQQAGILTEAERPQLWGLMQVYQEKLLLKAQALREAVERGLRASLEA
jgi:deferrochelatase/peroxidase EfeB